MLVGHPIQDSVNELQQQLAAVKAKCQADADEIGNLNKERQKLQAGPCNRCKGKDVVVAASNNKPPVPPLPNLATGVASKPTPNSKPKTPRASADKPKLVGVGMRLTDVYPHTVAEFVRSGAAHRSERIEVSATTRSVCMCAYVNVTHLCLCCRSVIISCL
jgi:hypothetical protein